MKRNEERIVVLLRPESPGRGELLGYNRSTLEAAFGLAKHKKAHITAIGVFASAQDDGICQSALDLGCDAALSIRVPVPYDFFGEALLLKTAIDSSNTTMVLCGDYDQKFQGGSLGAALAFMLDLPCITAVTDCRFKGDDYLVTRRTDTGLDQFRCPRPALLALVGPLEHAEETHLREGPKGSLFELEASALLEDLSVLYSRAPLATHAAPSASPEATELFSDPLALLERLREDNLWDAT